MRASNSYRTWAEIDLKALTFNLKRIRSLHPKAKVVGVVKADAYGHGLYEVCRSLATEGVKIFAVANIMEAQIVSRGVPSASVILLSPVLPNEIPEVVRQRRWIPTISNSQELAFFEREAQRQKKTIRVQFKLDTGMGRIGCFEEELLPLFQKIKTSRHLKLDALISHLSSADGDQAESIRQVNRLNAFCQKLSKKGLSIPTLHFQNSAGTLRLSHPSATIVRPGISLYGIPDPLPVWRKRFGPQPLKPVLSWKASVALVRDMPAGSFVSYARTYRTKKRSRIAVLAVGYADGVFRKLSNRGQVLIHGKRCPIVGRVTMDMIMVDVTKLPKVKWGDVAVLIGKSGREEITTQEFADWAETNTYEVLTHISKRVPRIF
jgi:alanine racemase